MVLGCALMAVACIQLLQDSDSNPAAGCLPAMLASSVTFQLAAMWRKLQFAMPMDVQLLHTLGTLLVQLS